MHYHYTEPKHSCQFETPQDEFRWVQSLATVQCMGELYEVQVWERTGAGE